MTVKKINNKKVVNKKSTYNNSLLFYLNEINKIPLLTREEEVDLTRKAKEGDKEAKEKVLRANLRFVVAVAKKYRNQGIPLADLINEGNIGLLTAIEKFDVDKGYHFISYAVWWIRQSILKAICEKSRMIRLPLNRANELVQIDKERRRLKEINDEEPTAEEVANNLNLDIELVKHLLKISKETISLEKPIFQEKKDKTSLGDFIHDDKMETPEKNIEDKSLNETINALLKTLSDKEKEIIEYRFGLNGSTPLSLKEIGKKYNLTKERIRQIEKNALKRLKHSTRSNRLRTFLEAQ